MCLLNDKYEYAIVAIGVFFICIFMWSYLKEQSEWDAFAELHNCKPVEYMKGGMNIGVGPTFGGSGGVSVLIIPEADKICYECDDGKRYWR